MFAASMWLRVSSNTALRVGTTDLGTPQANYGGEIAEIVLYNSVLTTSDRQLLEQYFRTRYAIP